MITQKDIESYIETKSSTCREAFSSIVATKSAPTKRIAIKVTEKMCASVVEVYLQNESVVKKSAINTVVNNLDLETFCVFCEAIDAEKKKVTMSRLLLGIPILRDLSLRLVCFVYELDYSQVKLLRSKKTELYLEVGGAMILGGLYLAIAKQSIE
jgi:hypothetical protein